MGVNSLFQSVSFVYSSLLINNVILGKAVVCQFIMIFFLQASQGRIEAFDCRAPFDPHITSALRPKLMFAITVQDGEPAILCYSNWEETPHSGNLRVSSASSTDFENHFLIIYWY